MYWKCQLPRGTYPNCGPLEEIISEWDVDAGELEVAADGPSHKVALLFRAHPGNTFHLWTWSVADDYFRSPTRFDDLVNILHGFVTNAARDSGVRYSMPFTTVSASE